MDIQFCCDPQKRALNQSEALLNHLIINIDMTHYSPDVCGF